MPRGLNEVWVEFAKAAYATGKAIADIVKDLIAAFGMVAKTALKYAQIGAGLIETGVAQPFEYWLRKSVEVTTPDGLPIWRAVRVPVYVGDTQADIDARIEAARRALQQRIDTGQYDFGSLFRAL